MGNFEPPGSGSRLDPTRLSLFLSQGDAVDEPVLPDGLPRSALSHMPASAGAGGGRAFIFSNDSNPNSLKPRGWGLVVPEDEKLAKQLMDSIRPLVELRAKQMGTTVEKLLASNVFKASSNPLLSESDAQEWVLRVYRQEDESASTRRSEENLPQFLLVLGDLHQVPETIPRSLMQLGCFVGRLAFTNEDGAPQLDLYNRYAQKVKAAEDPTRLLEPRSAQSGIYGVLDGTPATEAGWEQMMQPMHDRARRLGEEFRAKVQNAKNDAQLHSRDHLWNIAAELPASVLFTMSHGYGGPEKGWGDARNQRKRQGGMSFMGGAPRLNAEAAAEMKRPFLANGIWFMFACYGAGTPPESHFHHWLKEMPPEMFGPRGIDWIKRALPQSGGDNRPFIAALPQFMLAKEDGPLAFVGHLDLAWGYGFQTASGTGDPDPYLGVLADLLRGSRIGVAFNSLLKKRVRADGALLAGYNKLQLLRNRNAIKEWLPTDEQRKQEAWMTRQDLSGYVVLGDPAARLPLQVAWSDIETEAGQRPHEEKAAEPTAQSATTTVQVPPPPMNVVASPSAATPRAPQPEAQPEQPVNASLANFSERGARPSAVVEDAVLVKISAQLAALPYWKVEELLAEVILGELGPTALARKYGVQKREVEQLSARYRAAGRASLLALIPDWDRE